MKILEIGLGQKKKMTRNYAELFHKESYCARQPFTVSSLSYSCSSRTEVYKLLIIRKNKRERRIRSVAVHKDVNE